MNIFLTLNSFSFCGSEKHPTNFVFQSFDIRLNCSSSGVFGQSTLRSRKVIPNSTKSMRKTVAGITGVGSRKTKPTSKHRQPFCCFFPFFFDFFQDFCGVGCWIVFWHPPASDCFVHLFSRSVGGQSLREFQARFTLCISITKKIVPSLTTFATVISN